MKKLMMSSLIGCLMAMLPIAVMAQDSITVDRGGVVELKAAEGYTDYQWQVSSDAKYFVNLPDGKMQNFRGKVYAPNFYRVLAKDKNNETVCLDTWDVRLTKIPQSVSCGISGAGQGYVETIDGKVGAKGISIPSDVKNGVVCPALCFLLQCNRLRRQRKKRASALIEKPV